MACFHVSTMRYANQPPPARQHPSHCKGTISHMYTSVRVKHAGLSVPHLQSDNATYPLLMCWSCTAAGSESMQGGQQQEAAQQPHAQIDTFDLEKNLTDHHGMLTPLKADVQFKHIACGSYPRASMPAVTAQLSPCCCFSSCCCSAISVEGCW